MVTEDIYDQTARQWMSAGMNMMQRGNVRERKAEEVETHGQLSAFVMDEVFPAKKAGTIDGAQAMQMTLEKGRELGIDDLQSANFINTIFGVVNKMDDKGNGLKNFSAALDIRNKQMDFQNKQQTFRKSEQSLERGSVEGQVKRERAGRATEVEPLIKSAVQGARDKLKALDRKDLANPEDRADIIADLFEEDIILTEETQPYQDEIREIIDALSLNPDLDLDTLIEKSFGGAFRTESGVTSGLDRASKAALFGSAFIPGE